MPAMVNRGFTTLFSVGSQLEKLFVSLDKACTIKFFAEIQKHLFYNFQIRGQIVYARAEDFSAKIRYTSPNQNLQFFF